MSPLATIAQTPGLVAAYGFDEGAGTTVVDISDNDNNGTLGGGVTWSSQARFGKALAFNGVDALVTVVDSASLRLTTGMTLEAWVNPSTVSAAWRDVVYKGDDNYYLEATSTNSALPAARGSLGRAYGNSPLAPNTWTHLAATYDGSTVRLYVNGVQVSTAATTGSLVTSSHPLQIGGDSLYGQHFQGLIDEVRVYNRALGQAEIQTDMNTPVGGPVPPSDTIAPTVAITTPTSAPTYTTASSPLTLAGSASDNVGVTQVSWSNNRGGSGTATGTSGWSVSGIVLQPGTNILTVTARDAANNTSSATLTVTYTAAPDTTPPGAPSALSATAVSGTQVDLSWEPAQDNVAVANYIIYRCQGTGCTDFVNILTVPVPATALTNLGLVPNTNYSYIVRAADAAGNLGTASNVASVRTLATVPELVAAYSFEEGAGSGVADVSGKGNTGTIQNATWTTAGKYGKALLFNGANALVTIPDAASLRLTAAMTLEAWVNPSAVSSGWRDVIYKGHDNYYLEATSTQGGVPAAGGSFGEAYGTGVLAVNTWTHLAVTYDGAALRLYVNGVQVSSVARTGSIATSTNPLQIGGDSFYGQYFQGTIDEVRVYNVARTPTQIQADANTPIGSVGLPVASLSPTSLSFASQQTSTISDPQIVTLRNSGSAALTISSIAITGTNSADFSQEGNSCGATLAVGASCFISVSFMPHATGARTATLAISDNAPGSPHTLALTGTGSSGVALRPAAVVLTAGQTQQFSANASGVTWSVDGLVGGSASVGTITVQGLYTAPASVGSHIVTATTSDQLRSGNATVYISAYSGSFTHHNDNARTGRNLNETALSGANVDAATFGKLFAYQLDGVAHASPLYVAGVNIPGVGRRNVVYVATEHNSVYAFDADGRSSSALWKVSFVNPTAGVTTVPASDTAECCDIAPEIGITGTPVIDPASGTLYVVAKTKEVSGGTTRYVQRLHALDVATGAEKFGGPVQIQASVSGTGVGSQGGQVTFNSLRQNQRSALLLSNGVVYIAFGSHGDNQPYHGWLFGYHSTTLQQVMVLCATPNGEGAGIWMSNGGPAADSSGNIYFSTGDGSFGPGSRSYGNSLVKINPVGTVLDYFTPFNQATLDAADIDFGAGGILLLPDQPSARPHLVITAGKNGTIHLIDRDDMGGFNAAGDSQAVQSLPNIFPFGTPEPGNYSSPVYFNGTVYFSPVADAVKGFHLNNGLLSTAPTSQSSQLFAYRGGTLAISANGATNGILWAIEHPSPTTPGVLHAYDPSNLGIELYNSNQAASRDALGVAGKFSAPLVANGKVFVGAAAELIVYGLLP